jgi:acyl-CoA thioesterase-1
MIGSVLKGMDISWLSRRHPLAYRSVRRQVNAAAAILTIVMGLQPATAAEPVKVLALGDSLTAGYGLPPADGFTVRLQAALEANGVAAKVINAGVSGETSAGGLPVLDWQLGDKPDVAIVELGANDMLRGLDPKQTQANLDQILARLQTAHIPVLLCGMRAPTNWGADYAASFEAIYPALAKKYAVPLYPFFLDGVALDPKYIQPDGLHPNAAGVEVIVGRILPSVERLLGRPG